MRASTKLGLAVILCYLVAWLDRMAIALTLPSIQKDLALGPQTSGIIISAFFAGYALFQIPGGLLADRFGPRKVILGALAWWSVFTAATGLVGGLGSMVITRFLFGVGEGVFPAAVWKVISSWFSKKNRATANALVLSSIALGPALTPFVLHPLVSTVGWRGAYLVIGALGLVCVAAAWYAIYDSMQVGRGVSKRELDELEADSTTALANAEPTGTQGTFSDILRTPLAWVLFFVGVIGNIGMYGWLQWLPSYLQKVHGLTGVSYMFASAAPWATATVGCVLGGVLSDRFFRGRRKLLVGASQGLSVVALAAFAFFASSGGLGISLFIQCIASFFAFMAVSAIWSLPVNLLPPRLMGVASGFINTGGQLGGVLSGVVVGSYIQHCDGDYARMWDVVIVTGLINVVLALVGIRERRR